jgi:hypothetical protein
MKRAEGLTGSIVVLANMFLVPLGALLEAEGVTAAAYIKKWVPQF